MIPSELEYGVPRFLGVLVNALLEVEMIAGTRQSGPNVVTLTRVPLPIAVDIGRYAASCGKELLEEGFTVEEVVHGYGDICQTVTELAGEKRVNISLEEFHALNLLLDIAIADAVSSYGKHRDAAINAHGDHDSHGQMASLVDEQLNALDVALKAFDALKVGNLGVMGSTGTVLEDSLVRLRNLIKKSPAETRQARG